MHYDACMAHKTISLDLRAYETLRGMRIRPTESFSEVVLRLSSGAAPTARASTAVRELFAEGRELWLPDEAELDRLDAIQKTTRPRRNRRADA